MNMIENLNLFTYHIRYSDISKIIKTENFNWYNQYDYIKNAVEQIYHNLDYKFFLNEQKNVYLITENLRHSSNYDAFRFYEHFYSELTIGYYNISDQSKRKEIMNFLSEIDFTELFYNLGLLCDSLGNTDTAIYFISLADKEYCVKNKLTEGTFVKHLLSSRNLYLWVIMKNLFIDFYNYENNNKHFSNFKNMLILFDIKLEQSVLDDFINNLDVPTLFQLVVALTDIKKLDFDVLSKDKETHFKSIYKLKALGNLTWIFENYLKSNLKLYFNLDFDKETLGPILEKVLQMLGESYADYFKLRKKKIVSDYPSKFDQNTKGLSELIREINQLESNNKFKLFSHLILILYLFRNYTTHYLDNSLRLDSSYLKYLSVYLSIISCFLITEKQFQNKKESIIEFAVLIKNISAESN